MKWRNGEAVARFSVRSSRYSEQLDAIMRTVSTFSFGPLDIDEDDDVDEDEEVVDELELLEFLSNVPVISTLCPTCGESFDDSASSLYVLPLAAALDGVVAPAVPAVVPVAVVPVAVVPVVAPPEEYAPDEPDIDAFVRMKPASDELAAPVVPVVPVAPEVALARWRQPVTVI